MIYLFIAAITATMAYQSSGEGKSAEELDRKVKETKVMPYQDFKGDER